MSRRSASFDIVEEFESGHGTSAVSQCIRAKIARHQGHRTISTSKQLFGSRKRWYAWYDHSLGPLPPSRSILRMSPREYEELVCVLFRVANGTNHVAHERLAGVILQ